MKPHAYWSRRAALKTIAAAGVFATIPHWARTQTLNAGWRGRIANYLESLSRPDGGYAWPDQQFSHLTPTFAAIGCYRALGLTPPAVDRRIAFIQTHHPGRLKKLEQEHREFEYQQIQSLLWLAADASSFRKQVSNWKTPTTYLKQYEQQGYPVFRHEMTAFTCRALLGEPASDAGPEYVHYLNSRRRDNGSFNNTPGTDGTDGHVLNTWWGLQALDTLGRTREKQAETVPWLQACQLSDGGFTWQPKPAFAALDDVAYTWAAVRSLQLLKARPAEPDACVRYLLLLRNTDGGFGDRPEWRSNPVATYYALDALAALGAVGELAQPRARHSTQARPAIRDGTLPDGLQVFSVQIEAHGQGSPAEAVDLARALRIHLWGAKNAKPGWIDRAQTIAEEQKVPVRFFAANEEYGTWVRMPGLGTYSHMSDLVAPAGAQIGPSLANEGAVSWEDLRSRRLAPLQRGKGRLLWQFGENEELVRLCLDDSLERGGYSAISTFHFGNPDFTNSEPFLQRYCGKIPFIALQDAHGEEPWWFADMTTGFRTVFLATEPTWSGWLNALQRNWIAAIRHDAVSGFQTWMHAGSPEVADFVRKHSPAWQWWDNPHIARPLISLVALKPEDKFEVGCPREGVSVRVRCAWENTTQGRPKQPITELLRLTVDGAEVATTLVAPRQGRADAYADHYAIWHQAKPSSGNHQAIALVRHLPTNETRSRTLEFTV